MKKNRYSSLQSLGWARLIGSIAGAIVLLTTLGTIRWHRDTTPRPISRLTSEKSAFELHTCAECHADIVADFATSPHANTLHAGSDAEMRAVFAQHSVELDGRTFSFTEDQGELWLGSDDLNYRRRVDWVFGSGRHALTPVSLDRDGLTQLLVTYFADQQFRATPGLAVDSGGVPRLGERQGHADARRCFGCHVSSMPGETLFHGAAGLDCNRCHFETAAHAASDGEILPLPSWHELTPRQSVDRCGECHRRQDGMKPEEISVDETHLVRFAPVGLVMSRCFEVANAPENAGMYARLDCLTCHDPHLPSRTDPEYFEAICRQCHTPENLEPTSQASPPGHAAMRKPDRVVACSESPADSACLPCHMPKTDFAPGLQFTDHWIR